MFELLVSLSFKTKSYHRRLIILRFRFVYYPDSDQCSSQRHRLWYRREGEVCAFNSHSSELTSPPHRLLTFLKDSLKLTNNNTTTYYDILSISLCCPLSLRSLRKWMSPVHIFWDTVNVCIVYFYSSMLMQ